MLLVENRDSFTYNIVHALEKLGVSLEICSNTSEKIFLNQFPLIIGPGPKSPVEAGFILPFLKTCPDVPILGICLGHQALGEAFKAAVIRGDRPIHGKSSPIYHNGKDLFNGIPSPFCGMRYHSLLLERESLPNCLEIVAETEMGEVMAIKHRDYPYFGVQFHPDSFLTEFQEKFFSNWIAIASRSFPLSKSCELRYSQPILQESHS
jgi:anthranilate synthase/aminodeoxychorismate synthase-like glutamine amidotransferase